MIFLRVLPKMFLWPTTRGPRARGLRFIEPPEPPVPMPLVVGILQLDTVEPCTTRASQRSSVLPTGTGDRETVYSGSRHVTWAILAAPEVPTPLIYSI